ncbi:MAG: flagellar basal body-associated FliL family protein [Bacillota bacterium]
MADENNEKQGMNWMKMVAIFLVMIIVAAGTSYGVMTYLTRERTEEEEEKKEFGPTYTLGDFTVNLGDSNGYQFIKSSIVVEVDNEEVITELEKRSPQVRDVIISTMRNAEVSEIEEPGAKKLKTKIQNDINSLLDSGQVKNVYFTQLVVQ